MKKFMFLLFILAGAYHPLNATTPEEDTESNDSFATAQVLPATFLGGFSSGSIDGGITSTDDVDLFKVEGLSAGDYLTATLFGIDLSGGPIPSGASLGIFNSSKALILRDDMEATDNLSAINLILPSSEDYFLGVTGFNNVDFFEGVNHGQQFLYHLVVSRSPLLTNALDPLVVPEPATYLLLGSSLLLTARRRGVVEM